MPQIPPMPQPPQAQGTSSGAQQGAQVDPTKIAEFLKRQKVDPSVPYLQLKDKQTGKMMYVPNPAYDASKAQPQAEEDLEERSYCSVVHNYCPESQECVWWFGPAAGEEKSPDEAGGCVKVGEVVSSDRANVARAEFFERAVKVVEAVLTADPESSGLANLIGQAATLFQLQNEDIIRKSGVTLPKKEKKNTKATEAKTKSLPVVSETTEPEKKFDVKSDEVLPKKVEEKTEENPEKKIEEKASEDSSEKTDQ